VKEVGRKTKASWQIDDDKTMANKARDSVTRAIQPEFGHLHITMHSVGHWTNFDMIRRKRGSHPQYLLSFPTTAPARKLEDALGRYAELGQACTAALL
jgi:hypothetical protein